MSDQIVSFYEGFLSRTLSVVSKVEFNSNDEAIAHIFTLLSSSIEFLDNMCVLARNESKIGIPILLRSILEAAVDMQFILIEKDNYKRIEIEDALLWQGIIESAYKGNEYVGNMRNDPSFENEVKRNTANLKKLKNSGITKADISFKFKSTIFADAYESLYATLCSRLLCFGRAEVYFISPGPVVAWRTSSQRYLPLAARVGDARAHRGSRLA